MKYVAAKNFDAGFGVVKKGSPVEYDESLLKEGLLVGVPDDEDEKQEPDPEKDLASAGVVLHTTGFISENQSGSDAEPEAEEPASEAPGTAPDGAAKPAPAPALARGGKGKSGKKQNGKQGA